MFAEFSVSAGIAIFIFVVLVAYLLITIVIKKEVPKFYVYSVLRNNSKRRIIKSGTHFLLPFIDRLEHKISLKPKLVKISKQDAYSADGQQLSFSAEFEYQIIDPQLYVDSGLVKQDFLEISVANIINKVIKQLSAQLVLSSKTAFNTLVCDELSNLVTNYGIKLVTVCLSNLDLTVPEMAEYQQALAEYDELVTANNGLLVEQDIIQVEDNSDWHGEAAPCFEVLLRQAVDANKRNWNLIDEISELEQEIASFELLGDKHFAKEYPIIDQSGFTYSIIDQPELENRP